jgi:replication factor C subunit 2/4
MNEITWIEKYRPSSFDDIILNDCVKLKLSHIIETKNMPNIIITGEYGTGKTTTIKCIKNILFGKYGQSNSLELNASDDRGVKTVYEYITTFCKKKMDIPIDEKHLYSRHKIIILDEADNITKKAQKLISVLIDRYYNSVRFAFTCNRLYEIIELIQSKCTIIKYNSNYMPGILYRLEFICRNENINISKKTLQTIIKNSKYDIRKCINALQITASNKDMTTRDTINSDMLQLIHNCYNNNFKNVLLIATKQLDIGYNATDILICLLNTLVDINEKNVQEYNANIIINYIAIVCNHYAEACQNNDVKMQLIACMVNIFNSNTVV